MRTPLQPKPHKKSSLLAKDEPIPGPNAAKIRDLEARIARARTSLATSQQRMDLLMRFPQCDDEYAGKLCNVETAMKLAEGMIERFQKKITLLRS